MKKFTIFFTLGIAYAVVAGLSPEYGLYSSFMGKQKNISLKLN